MSAGAANLCQASVPSLAHCQARARPARLLLSCPAASCPMEQPAASCFPGSRPHTTRRTTKK